MPRTRAPWARWNPLGPSGGSISGDAHKITLHTMECTCWPGYGGGGSAPHLSVDPASGEARQHIDFDQAARALASPGSPRSPNRDAGLNIQIEIQGFARETPDYPDSWYAQLGEWLAWLCAEWEVPQAFPFAFGGEDGYGRRGRYRTGWDAFRGASGIVGHSNVPGNDHWDPGALDQGRLLAAMGSGPHSPTTRAHVVQRGDTLHRIARDGGTTVPALLAANPAITDPDVIHVGQRITLPEPVPTAEHLVRAGETLRGIASGRGTTLASLLDLNPDIKDPDLIRVGQRIRYPVTS